MAAAAAGQNRMWDFLDRFYAHQGEENSGYVTEGFLRSVGSEVSGLDVAGALRESQAQAALDVLAAAHRRADAVGIDYTPAFVLGPTGRKGRVLELSSLDAGAFRGPIERELAR
jgi:protein-disulfide isomerase